MTRKHLATYPGPTVLTPLLQTHADRLAADRGHVLGPWIAAKKKIGKACTRAVCYSCGSTAIIMPVGNPAVQQGPYKGVPAIRGEALFEDCAASTPASSSSTATKRSLR